MQLKISRSSGNYLVLQLPGAVLTYFTDPGPEPEVGIKLADGAEGDDQFRKFLAQVVECEDQGPVPAVKTLRDLRKEIVRLQEENEHLCDKIRQQGIALTQAAPTAVDELKLRIYEAKIGEGVDGMSMATGALTVGAESAKGQYDGVWVPNPDHIFQGKSLYWLQGFQANREWRQDCQHSNISGEAYPTRPENPYALVETGQGYEHNKLHSWGSGWSECNEYPLDSMPDPTTFIINLEKAK